MKNTEIISREDFITLMKPQIDAKDFDLTLKVFTLYENDLPNEVMLLMSLGIRAGKLHSVLDDLLNHNNNHLGFMPPEERRKGMDSRTQFVFTEIRLGLLD
jgi:hypothetical protein